MDLNINIHETVGGDLFVKELAYVEGFYGDNTIAFNNSVSITILTKHTSRKTGTIKAFVHNHSAKDVTNKFKIIDDGWYSVLHCIIPNQTWHDNQGDSSDSEDDMYYIYYNDSGELIQCTSDGTETVLEVDSMIPLLSGSTAAWYVSRETFVLFNLWQCYLNYCKKMLEDECSKDSSCLDCDDELTKNRNLIWIFLNVIQYYVKFRQLQEAQELLESISGGCNTLCSNEMFSKQYNCGCAK